jgi:hypothetical protein
VAAVPGVEGIADRLHVRPATRMTDKEIRVHMRDMLEEASFRDLELHELEEDGEDRLVHGAPASARAASVSRSRTASSRSTAGCPASPPNGWPASWRGGYRACAMSLTA